jgi:hypothetical protein
MTTGELLYLSLVVVAFAAFVVGLAIATTGVPGPDMPKEG